MLPAENGQHLTFTHYSVDDHYQVHVDSNLQVARIATALLFLEQPEEGGELIFPWAQGVISLNRSATDSATGGDAAGASERDCTAATAAPPAGVHGRGRSLEDYYALDTLPTLDTTGMCQAPTEALRIEPRVGRLVVFFNHDSMLRTLRPVTLHGSCPVAKGRKRIAQRWYQWHALKEPNTLGQLLERAFGQNWKVNFRAQLPPPPSPTPPAVSSTADDVIIASDRCFDRGPWPCTENGCPSPSLACTDLAALEACSLAFDDVWTEPPEGCQGKKVAALCPRACGACGAV